MGETCLVARSVPSAGGIAYAPTLLVWRGRPYWHAACAFTTHFVSLFIARVTGGNVGLPPHKPRRRVALGHSSGAFVDVSVPPTKLKP